MTTGPLAVRSDSLTGLPSVPFSVKSGAFCPTSSALAAPATATLMNTALTRLRASSKELRIGPSLAGRPVVGTIGRDDAFAERACQVLLPCPGIDHLNQIDRWQRWRRDASRATGSCRRRAPPASCSA